jgi:hypothetical protein
MEFNTGSIFFFQIVVPPLPGKAIKRQLPFRNDDGIYDEEFIEDRRKSLEGFVNKCVSILTFKHHNLNLLK